MYFLDSFFRPLASAPLPTQRTIDLLRVPSVPHRDQGQAKADVLGCQCLLLRSLGQNTSFKAQARVAVRVTLHVMARGSQTQPGWGMARALVFYSVKDSCPFEHLRCVMEGH